VDGGGGGVTESPAASEPPQAAAQVTPVPALRQTVTRAAPPAEPVLRVLPLGSGLVLIGLGLGLAFVGLRLRRA
jgi:hypothetical protein